MKVVYKIRSESDKFQVSYTSGKVAHSGKIPRTSASLLAYSMRASLLAYSIGIQHPCKLAGIQHPCKEPREPCGHAVWLSMRATLAEAATRTQRAPSLWPHRTKARWTP
jgi:hypothetical protein